MGNNYFVYLDWYNSDVQTENPCFVFTPRTPVSWADWSGWWDQLTEPMIAALHVMDSLISVYPVDTSRIYVYGISMGGEGTFDLLHKRPNKFAAAMSVCGGGQPFWAENISKTPFWMFHGDADAAEKRLDDHHHQPRARDRNAGFAVNDPAGICFRLADGAGDDQKYTKQ